MEKFIEVTTSNNSKKVINTSLIKEISVYESENSGSVIVLSDQSKYFVREPYSVLKEMTGLSS